jgi:hypothetical protein
MTTWRKVLAWETVPEQGDWAAQSLSAGALNKELTELKEAGDESVHTYSINWSGYAYGSSTVLGRNIEEAKVMQEHGFDYNFTEDGTDAWESRGIHGDDTDEEEDW